MNMIVGRNSATGSHGNPSNGGCVTMTDNAPQFRFYQNDHLGSVRAVVSSTGQVLQRNAYYPFGGLYQADATDDTFRYRYNGKELDRTFGHNMYDYGARWQDPYLGRFTTIDPLAEKYYHLSPYAYCANNPMNAVDPDGRRIYIPKYQSFIVSLINQLAQGEYCVSPNGFLFLSKSTNDLYKSEYYAERLNSAISDVRSTITINIGYTDRGNGETQMRTNHDADIIFTGASYDKLEDNEGNIIYDGPEYILAHELVGHAIPWTNPSILEDPRETGYAYDSENIIRLETNAPLRSVKNGLKDSSFKNSGMYDIPWQKNIRGGFMQNRAIDDYIQELLILY
jgi:RHS repeat-associated protein